jgi:methionyl-tRNA formyltransferase
MALRLIFMGTPEFSVTVLNALVEAGHEIIAVYTQPPRAAGRRGLELTPSPVQKRAEALGLPVYSPVKLKDESEHEKLRGFNADAAVVVAYGLLLPQAVLDAPKHGCFNIHASLLPRWRGAAPIHRAIMAGDSQTGVMVMQMEAGLDTGPVALTTVLDIGPDETTGALHDRLAVAGAELIVEAMAQLEAGTLTTVPQPEAGANYAAKIDKAETRIDWAKPAQDVHNHIRGLSPWPGAWCEMDFGASFERVKILRSRVAEKGGVVQPCADGSIELVDVQRSGGKAMSGAELMRGSKPKAIR